MCVCVCEIVKPCHIHHGVDVRVSPRGGTYVSLPTLVPEQAGREGVKTNPPAHLEEDPKALPIATTTSSRCKTIPGKWRRGWGGGGGGG